MRTSGPQRNWLRWIPFVLASVAAIVLLVTFGPFVLNPPAVPGGAPSHDLAQNVAAAHLIASGRGAALYDQAAEFDQRVELVGHEASVIYPPGLPFVSPPWRALVYVPLIWLPFPVLAAIHRVLLLGSLTAAMYLMRGWLPVAWPFAALLTTITPASLGGLQAGQTIHFTLLAWVVAARLVDRGWPNLAALALVTASFKPDLVALGVGLVALRGGWRAAIAASAGLYAVSAIVTGDPGWIVSWWQAATGAVVPFTGPLRFVRPELLVPVLAAAAWLAAPAGWRGPLVLLLPVASLAATPYHWGYDDLIAAPAAWLGVWLVVRAWRWVSPSIATAIASRAVPRLER